LLGYQTPAGLAAACAAGADALAESGSRTRGCLPRSDPTLNLHIARYRKSKPVNRS